MAKLKYAEDLKQAILDQIYPIGSIYMTIESGNPSSKLGGTWTQLSGGYLYASQNEITQTNFSGRNTQNGGPTTTGTTTLTIDQIPAHKHNFRPDGRKMVNVTSGWVTNGDFVAINTFGGYRLELYPATVEAGGGQGHNHSIAQHSHNIATLDVFMWKRIA